MAVNHTEPKHKYYFRWRSVVVTLVTAIGLISLIAFSSVHWVERQVLTTSNWVKIVAPLPQNSTVANALSSYSVNKIFSSTDLQNKIAGVLPPKASFLAPTIASELQSRLYKRTTTIIESDQFNYVWVSANRVASQKILSSARNTPQPAKTAKIANFTINLSAIRQSVVKLVGNNIADSSSSNISVNLKIKMDKLSRYVRLIDFLNAVLGLFALVLLLGAIVLSTRPRRLIKVISLSILVIGLLQLIGVKALRPIVLNQIHSYNYKPAVDVVYNAIVANYYKTAVVTVIIGLAIYLSSIILNRKLLVKNKWLKNQLKSLDKSKFIKNLHFWRQFVGKYLLILSILVVLIGLAIMAFLLTLNTTGIISALLIIILLVEIVNLASPRPRISPIR